MAKKSRVPTEFRGMTSPFKAQKLGQIPHPFDAFSEESNEQERKVVLEALSWVKEEIPSDELLSMEVKKRKKTWGEILDPESGFPELENLAAFNTAKKVYHKKSLAKYFGGDLYYAYKDLKAKRKVKTSLLVGSGILAGAVLGLVLGTVVLPGIGSAIGGTTGALIGGVVGAAGGGIGLSMIGAFIGTVLSSKLAAKFFKKEKKYELSKRITNEIESKIGINADVAQLINGYLYNRQQAVNSPLCKQYYKVLRKVGIGNANPRAMEKIAHFLIHEYFFLKKASQAHPHDKSLEQEFAAVSHMLTHLQKARGLSIYTRDIIEQVLNSKDSPRALTSVVTNQDEIPLAIALNPSPMMRQQRKSAEEPHPHQAGLCHQSSASLAKGALKEINEQFLQWTRRLPEIKQVDYVKLSSSKYKKYQYHMLTADNRELPTMTLYRRIEPQRRYTEISIGDTKNLNEADRALVARLLIEQSRLYAQKTGLPHLKIRANGDEKLAIQLLALGLKQQLVVELDEEEFPAATADGKAKRQDMSEQARRLAGIKPAHLVKLSDTRLKKRQT